jgi:Holliday junction resolvasome RuvABC endonuclease subunit
MVNGQRHAVYTALGIDEPQAPDSTPPTLETDIDDLTDKQLMDLFVKFTRWTDYFQNQLAIEEIFEHHAEMEVRKLEGLYLTRHRPEKASEAVTWVRAQMETDHDIQAARDALKLYYARRKLKQMLFESSERDAAVVSRELTRRTDAKSPGYRRADRGAP